MVAALLTFSILTLASAQQPAEEMGNATFALFDTLLASSRYDKRIRPWDGGATNVEVDVYIRSISNVDEMAMEFDIDVLIRQHWLDGRLTYNTTVSEDGDVMSFVSGTPEVADGIWKPDLFFANEKKGFLHDITKPNTMLRLYSNGQIMYNGRYSLTLSCDMHFENFPFDTQECIVQLGSFSLTEKSLKFLWKATDPITINDELKLPKFYLNKISVLSCVNQHYTGNFSCLRMQFTLKRQLGYHFIQSYVPNFLLVSASWISFWLDCDAIPARITLGVTIVLTTTAQGSNVQTTLPPVSYIKAIDIWLGACIVFVFAALVEFAIVNVTARREAKRLQRSKIIAARSLKHERRASGGNMNNHSDGETLELKLINSDRTDPGMIRTGQRNSLEFLDNRSAKSIDTVARVIFPLAFLMFCTLYIYLYVIRL